MSGPVVLVALLSLIQVGSTFKRCKYNQDLIEPYLADKENLYCFDEEGFNHVVDDSARLCTEDFGERGDGMDVRCPDGFVLVGYSFYDCDTETGILATFLGNDDVLTQYSACVADADVATVCTGVDSASESNKLKVDQDVGKVANIDLVAEDATEYVSYAMACGDGFGFQADVSSPVYGYCSGNADGNQFTLDGTDGCYELCSPDNTNLEGVTLNLEAGSRHGASVSAEVECPSGFDIAFGAADSYDFTCAGLFEGEANNGVFNCEEENCPECLAQCPANPEPAQITNFGDVENMAGVVNLEAAASGQTVMAGVTCNEGFALAEGAEQKYDFQCDSNENDTEANSGRWTLVNDLPICHPVCPSDSFAEIANVETITITESGVEGKTVTGVVSCDSGFSLEGDDKTFEFECNSGQFTAVGDGPQCLKECIVPEDTGNFTFFKGKGEDEEQVEAGDVVRPGRSHIRVACKNDTLNLVGSPTMSCNPEGELVHDDDEAPICADAEICRAPKVVQGNVNTKNNVIVGSVFTITCNPSYWFDTKTVKKYNPDELTEEGFSRAEVECQGEDLPEFSCYFGCLAPDFQGGAVYPDMAEEGQAPYEIGAVVEFQCLEDAGTLEGDAQATCEVGGIGSPVCGACSFALSLFLSVTLFFFLLL